jgi:rhodanese-related sulfurtransferase
MNIFSMLFVKNNFDNLSPDEFKNKLNEDKKSVLIDVRTKAEFSASRIPQAKLIDISSSSFSGEIEKLDKTKSYFVYCQSGMRSRAACSNMKKLGFENVYNLSGGISGWNGRLER